MEMKSATVSSWPRVYIPDACRNVEIIIGIDEAGRAQLFFVKIPIAHIVIY